jgi:hypothetical protein
VIHAQDDAYTRLQFILIGIDSIEMTYW